MKKFLLSLFAALTAFAAVAAEISVALYPYVPDIAAYRSALVQVWTAAGETDTLTFVDWDCYVSDYPTNVDVTVYDGQFLKKYVRANALLPAEPLDESERANFPAWSLDGAELEGTVWGLPQMICTHFLYRRAGETGEPTERATENDLPEKYPQLKNGGWKIFALDELMPVRAAWLAEKPNRLLADFSETLRVMSPDLRTRVTFTPYAATNTPYYVDYVSVSASCAPAKRPAAHRLTKLLVSKAYLSAALWPADAPPQYILPARLDVFRAFAGRDPLYQKFLDFALRPTNHTMPMSN